MVKKIKSDIKEGFKSRKINVFFLFLFFSFIILIFTKLSKDYTNTIAFNIKKTNIPQEAIVLNDSGTILNITLKTHGFKWLKYYFNKPEIAIDFIEDIYKTDSTFVWNKSKAYLLASTQFGKQVEVLNISPDTLKFKYDVNLVKKIPVLLNANIKFSPGFDVVGEYKISPDSIKIIGPNVYVSKIQKIETTPVELDNVKTDLQETIKLHLPKESKVLKFSETEISLSVDVEKFTEGTLKIPITIKNAPTDKVIKYFPKTVNVTYYTSLKNYKSISEKDFKVECDFKKKPNNKSFLLPKLTIVPSAVKRAKMNKQHIEFIIIE